MVSTSVLTRAGGCGDRIMHFCHVALGRELTFSPGSALVKPRLRFAVLMKMNTIWTEKPAPMRHGSSRVESRA